MAGTIWERIQDQVSGNVKPENKHRFPWDPQPTGTPSLGTPGAYPENILSAGPTQDVIRDQITTSASPAATASQPVDRAEEAAIQIAEAKARTAASEAAIAERKQAEAESPAAAEAAGLALRKAQIDITTAQIQLAKAQDPNNNPQAVARLEAQLQQERDRLKQEFDIAMKDAEFQNQWQILQAQNEEAARRQQQDIEARAAEGLAGRTHTSSENRIGREFTSAENAAGRGHTTTERLGSEAFTAGQNTLQRDLQLQTTKLTAGVQLRGQEIDRLQAMDSFTTNTIANQIRKGELDVDRGYKVMQSALAAHRLPSEIVSNIGSALAPFVPHLSSYKAGDIPLGFESGGPFETALRQGGATSYDPSAYAAKPVGVDLFGIAKNFGAHDPGKLPDPSSVIPKVGNINTSPTSALANFEMPQEAQQALLAKLGSYNV